MSDDARNSSQQRYHFKLRLVVKHPNIDPAEITRQLGLMPHLNVAARDARITPAGKSLPGVYRETIWGWAKRIEQKRDFFEEVAKLGRQLQLHGNFIAQLNEQGGAISLIVDLPGDQNIGSILNWSDMKALADLRIDVGIEVFPEFK